MNACARCGTAFGAKRAGHRFCSKACRCAARLSELAATRRAAGMAEVRSDEWRARLSAAQPTKGKQIAPARVCDHCHQEFRTSEERRLERSQRFCSRACQYAAMWGEWPMCGHCGGPSNGHRWCSKRCAERAKAARRERQKRGAPPNPSDDIPLPLLAERDGWRCALCRRKVSRTARAGTPKSASIDHLIPLSAGGSHTWGNVQLAHWICNTRRGVGGAVQLRLGAETAERPAWACKGCGQSLAFGRGRVWCSAECERIAARAPTRACSECGAPFDGMSRPAGKTCSPRCADVRRRRLYLERSPLWYGQPRESVRPAMRICAYCGASFSSDIPHARYCSRTCKHRASSRRHDARARVMSGGPVDNLPGDPPPATTDAGVSVHTQDRRGLSA
jgi:HNH endonuclease